MGMERKRGLGATVVPAGPNLVSTWRQIATQGGEMPLVVALDQLNTALGTRYRHDSITQWEQSLNGRKPSQEVINYMMSIVLPYLLKEAGLSAYKAKAITEKVYIANQPGSQ